MDLFTGFSPPNPSCYGCIVELLPSLSNSSSVYSIYNNNNNIIIITIIRPQELLERDVLWTLWIFVTASMDYSLAVTGYCGYCGYL